MTDEGRDILARMLRAQAYRELGAIQVLDAGLAFTSEPARRTTLERQRREEQSHLTGALAVWSALVERPTRDLHEVARERLAACPLPTVRDDLDLTMAQFVFDRAGYFQLRESADCPFAPYRDLVRRILVEEADHQEGGAGRLVSISARDPDRAQRVFEAWLRTSLRSFGRPDSALARRAVDMGLKPRTPEHVMRDFVHDLRPTLAATGLRLPPAAGLDLELPGGLL